LWLRYGVGALAVGVALGLKLLLDPWITDQSPFLLLAGAVALGAWFGGLGPGLLATALGALGADYFFLPPVGSLTGLGVAFLPLLLFSLQGLLISSLVEALRSARRRAESSVLEARRHQESLRESEERFRLLVQRVEDYAIFMLDPEGRITIWNEGAERIYAYGAKEILGKHFRVLCTPEDVERGHPEEELRIATEHGHHEEESERVRKDGSRFWASVLITALRDEEGSLRGFSKVVRDITERKRTAEELRRRLDSLLALYETGQLLSSSLEREEIGSRLLGIVERLSGATAAVVNLSDDESGKAPGKAPRAWRMIGSESLLSSVRNEPAVRTALRAAFEAEEERLVKTKGTDPEGRRLAGLFLPLRVRDRVVGVLEAYIPEEPAKSGTLETFTSVANQAASALENARIYEELSEHRLRLQHLVGKLVSAQEEERRRVAYEVHDGLAQVAAAAYQHLQNYAADNPPSATRDQEELDEALEMLRHTVGEARAVVADLRPTVLDDFGLARALRMQVERLSEEGLRATFEEDLGGGRLPEVVETTLFRVAQEAMTNVRKHSRAERVHVALGRRSRTIRLQVRDWGRGFVSGGRTGQDDPSERVGLSSMRERVALLGGHFEIQSEPGAGTVVVAEVPLLGEGATGGATNDG
jgi:PAS domain S-box-containing protein